VRVGNTRSVRDFTDARDAMRAYRLLAERGEPGEMYNVCSGEGTAVHQLLDRLLALSRVAGISVGGLDSLPHPSPADVPMQVGDPAHLRAATGWRRAIPFGQTLLDVLNDWRQRTVQL